MADDFGSDEAPERSEPSSRRKSAAQQDDGGGKTKLISIVLALVAVMVAMVQYTRISQERYRAMRMQELAQQYRQQVEFRDKAVQRRFDTIENNKQADMLESRYKPLESVTAHTRIDNRQ
ncbi:MAG: hypothetical protein HQM03_05230 [Magnetococcales bacterium]|nr:hypothetical protein [Magnetococcales bacterium]